jgi:hypothetical protein
MGKQNRQRRATKVKQRAAKQRSAREQTPRRDHTAQPLTAEAIGNTLMAAAYDLANGDSGAAKQCADEVTSERFLAYGMDVEKAAVLVGRHVLERVFKHGWLPEDLFQAARRKVDEFAVSYLIDALADYMQPYAPATVHPAWRDQVEQLDAVVWWSRDKPLLGQWTAKHILTDTEAMTTVVEVLGLLITLHPLESILPLPGTAVRQRPVEHHNVNEKMLSRVRALLAKAESSSYPEEAEALSAKAQELMTRHALDRVLVEADTSVPSLVSTHRLWLDTPYLDAKSLLVDVVAQANRCRAIFHPKWGFVSVMGDENDLESVELLTTSLLLQATRAMIASGAQTSGTGQSRTRSYRQSFLVAYATRIGERLEKATESTIADASDSARLLPVLASQQKKVDAAFETMFPSVVGKRVSVSNAAGWGAGKAAADRALLETRRSVGG